MIVYVNDAFCTLSGYSTDVLVGHSALLLGGARPDTESARRLWSTSVAEGLPVIVTKWRPDGASYRAETALLPLRSSRGEVSHVLAFEQEVAKARPSSAAPSDDTAAPLATRVIASIMMSLASTAMRHREALWRLRAAGHAQAKLELALANALSNAERALDAVHRLSEAGAEPDAFRVKGAIAVLVELCAHDLRTEAEIERRYGPPAVSGTLQRRAVSRTDAPSEAASPNITLPRAMERAE
jgi:PAS domain S-box-containing protein